MTLVSFRLDRKNLGNLKELFGKMVQRPPPPPLAKLMASFASFHDLLDPSWPLLWLPFSYEKRKTSVFGNYRSPKNSFFQDGFKCEGYPHSRFPAKKDRILYTTPCLGYLRLPSLSPRVCTGARLSSDPLYPLVVAGCL